METLVRDEKGPKSVPGHNLELNEEVKGKLYIAVRTKKVLAKEYGTKCSIPTCKRPAEQLHHTQTFALSKRHDPHFLAPLCKDHHVIVHAINVKVQERRAVK